MAGVRRLAHEIRVAARMAGRALRARASGSRGDVQDPAAFRKELERWTTSLGERAPEQHRWCELPATRPPWFDTGLDLRAGDSVTWFACGRVYLSKLLDIWVGPAFQLWARVGDEGPVFRGTRDTHTFTAARDGRLWLATYFPGEWADPTGRLAVSPAEYATVSGGLSVMLLKWPRGADSRNLFRTWAADTDAPQAVRDEARRLDCSVPAPAGWNYHWVLGDSEIFTQQQPDGAAPRLCCHTHGDVGILQRATPLALEPGTRLQWSWRVDELPTDLPEDTLPSHDYVSIAVEFDDGQDITYYWSSSLPAGSAYRCPLPTWAGRETHVVVRSGSIGLGRWLDEERDLFDDYARMIGGPARNVAKVWLIAVSPFGRGHGRCEYANIALQGPAGRVRVL